MEFTEFDINNSNTNNNQLNNDNLISFDEGIKITITNTQYNENNIEIYFSQELINELKNGLENESYNELENESYDELQEFINNRTECNDHPELYENNYDHTHKYFNQVVPYNPHTIIQNITDQSFSDGPHIPKPDLMVYAQSYNFLRILSGVGGLSYSS